MSGADSERLLKLQDVAARLSICVRGVYRLITSGELPQPVKVMGASRMPESEVNAYLNKILGERGQ
jgi:predicted DNA-binding transcriptional regulator AlpA